MAKYDEVIREFQKKRIEKEMDLSKHKQQRQNFLQRLADQADAEMQDGKRRRRSRAII